MEKLDVSWLDFGRALSPQWVGLRLAIAHYGDGGDARVCPTDCSRWADIVVAKTAHRVTVRNGVGRFHLHSTCCNVGKTHAPCAYVNSVV